MPPLPYPEEILRSLERPGRYLGTEINARPNLEPDGEGRLLRVALAFPDVYEIAFSHLGHKILYGILNSAPGFSAERVYAPWLDLEGYLRKGRIPLKSLESKTPLGDFGVLGFSLQYELGYTNILNMLELSGIPLRAKDRGEGFPLVVAGGPGAANPEPIADFFDAFFLGDAEPNILSDYAVIKEWRFSGAPKEELFRALSAREGVYVPRLFSPRYGPPGPQGLAPFLGAEPLGGAGRPRAAKAKSLSGCFFPGSLVVPFVKPVHDRVAVEIARGCTRGCRFCQAGYLYRPVRERERDKVLALIESNLAATGQDEAAFLALSAGDHSQIAELVGGFMDRHGGERVSLSLPSLRVRSLSKSLAESILRVRKTGFTVAPEAGTARLRAVINKDLSEEDIFRAAEVSRSLGWRTLKLYFMCGLPTETGEDLDAIADLSMRLSKATRGRLNVGLAHFTPKAHTPFQWQPGSTAAEIRGRLDRVRDRARARGLAVKFQDPGASLAEALVARGDRRMAGVIERVFRKGARFEAWADHFRLGLWEEALAEEGLPLGGLLRARDPGGPLPWDHLSYGVTKGFLLSELALAMRGLPSPDCREAGCLGCGVCGDGLGVSLAGPLPPAPSAPGAPGPGGPAPPPIGDTGPTPGGGAPAGGQGAEGPTGGAAPGPGAAQDPSPGPAPGGPQWSKGSEGGKARPKGQGPAPPSHDYFLSFQKAGPSVFLGHLETAELFKRAFRKAGLPLSYSQGFHPQPKLSFLTALPLGVESLDECLLFSLGEPFPAGRIGAALSFPEGITVNRVSPRPPQSPKPRLKGSGWLLTSPSPLWLGPPPFPGATLAYQDQKGRERAFLLSEYLISFAIESPTRLTLDLLMAEKGSPPPARAALALWGLPPGTPLGLSKLRTILA
jgi:radical SAM family uncharacterized protein/radical SAM-linked protein